MAGIIQIGGQSGLSLYGVIRNGAGSVWDGSTFSAFNASNWSTYSVAMTEQGATGYYKGNFPSGVASAGKYSISIHAGSPAAAADPVIGFGSIMWDGAAEEQTVGQILKGFRLDQLLTATWASVKPTIGSFFDLFMSKDSGQTFLQSRDSLEAQRASGAASLTPASLASAVWDEPLSISTHNIGDSAGERLRAVDDKLPSGNLSAFDPSTQKVNLQNDQSSVTIGTINNLSAAALALIRAQVTGAMNLDTMSELQAVPPSNATVYQALMFIYQALRNKRTASAGSEELYNNAGSIIGSAAVSDDGVTFSKEKFS